MCKMSARAGRVLALVFVTLIFDLQGFFFYITVLMPPSQYFLRWIILIPRWSRKFMAIMGWTKAKEGISKVVTAQHNHITRTPVKISTWFFIPSRRKVFSYSTMSRKSKFASYYQIKDKAEDMVAVNWSHHGRLQN